MEQPVTARLADAYTSVLQNGKLQKQALCMCDKMKRQQAIENKYFGDGVRVVK